MAVELCPETGRKMTTETTSTTSTTTGIALTDVAAAKVAAEKAKLAASKKIVCKKGSQVKTFVAPKCPPGWAKSKT